MAKKTISARVPEELFTKLEEMCQQTGLNQTDLITEALSQYLGFSGTNVSDRLSALEKEVGQLKGKLRLLSV